MYGPEMPLLVVDHLCLKPITTIFRCDDIKFHNGNCSHKHTDKSLCEWIEETPIWKNLAKPETLTKDGQRDNRYNEVGV